MARGGKVYLGIITAAIFILLEFAALSMLKRSSVIQDIWINRISHNAMAHAWGLTSQVKNYFSLKASNEILEGRNYELFKELQHYKEMERHLQALALLDSAGFPGTFEYIPARITAMGTNTRHNYVIIDKGSEDGILNGSSIITPNGVVGVIHSVDKHYSYGLSLMNEHVVVSARIGRKGLVAPLKWDGKSSDRAILSDIPLHLDIPVGDTVRTSGISIIYPPDIPLGVTAGTRMMDGATRVVDVQLFNDLKSLSYVIVAGNPDRETIEAMTK